METIDKQSPQVIDDAVRLLKSDFVELYVKSGFDKTQAALTWHAVRVSPKGREALDALKLPKHIQAATMISDIDEEVQIRTKTKNKMAKKKSVEKQKPVKQKKVKSVDGERGQKTAVAKQLIAGGEKDVAVISEKSGAAIAYVRTLLYNARKAAKA